MKPPLAPDDKRPPDDTEVQIDPAVVAQLYLRAFALLDQLDVFMRELARASQEGRR